AALLALVEAAQSFDPSRNVNFATYARHRIEGALRDARRESLRQASWPTREKESRPKRTSQTVQSTFWTLCAAPDAPVGTELEVHDTVREWIRNLPRLQSLACRHIYLEGKTQEEAAALIGCSPPTLSRIHREALATIQYSCRGA